MAEVAGIAEVAPGRVDTRLIDTRRLETLVNVLALVVDLDKPRRAVAHKRAHRVVANTSSLATAMGARSALIKICEVW